MPAAFLAVLVAWAPWPFGGVTAWASATLVVAGAAALIAALAAPSWAPAMRPVAVPAAALAALALLGLLQGASWPAGVVERVSPEHLRLARDAQAALEPGASPEVRTLPLTLAPEVTRRTAILFGGLAAALAAAAVAGRARGGRRVLGAAVVATALVQVFYGAPRWLSGERTMWGVEVPGSERLRGTFVNPNHLATYLEIALAVAFAWTWWALGRARRDGSIERAVALVAGPALAWLTLFVALAFTGSRAGLAAAVAAVGVQGLVAAGRRRGARRTILRSALWSLVFLAAGVAAILWLGPQVGFGRWLASDHELAWQFRLEVYDGTAELWRRFPWLGTGLGSYLHAFPMVQPGSPELTWWHAHSDPLELLATAGVAGALVAGVGLVFLAATLVRVARHGARSEDRAAGLAALGALVAVGLHETLDFGLTMAANAFTLAVVLGAAAGAPSGAPLRRGPARSREATPGPGPPAGEGPG